MRSQDRLGLRAWLVVLVGVVVLATVGASLAEMGSALRGDVPYLETAPAGPLAKWVTDDIRQMRAYPEQPPVIPHAIEGYQLSVNANRCLSCHKREFTQGSGAPMISVTHYMDRDGQMLADVSPRRYFCTACHVPQADARPLVGNTFVDMSEMGLRPAGED